MPFYSSKDKLKRRRIAKERNVQLDIGQGGDTENDSEDQYRQPTTFYIPSTRRNLAYSGGYVPYENWSRGYFTASLSADVSAISISQNGNIIPMSLDSVKTYPDRTLQQLINDGEISVAWYADGLVIPGETSASLTPGVGNDGANIKAEVTDSSNAVTTSNTITYYFSYYLDFDGIDDYVALSNFYYESTNIGSFAVEAWVKVPSDGGNWAILDFDRSEYYTCCVGVLGNNSVGHGDYIGFHTANVNGIDDMWSNFSNIRDNVWHHVAWVYDATTATKYIYVDGVEDSTQTINNNEIGTGIVRYAIIGDGSEAESFDGMRNETYHKGGIESIKVWHVYRTASEITNNMNTVLTGTEVGLRAYYNMNEGSGTTISDETSNNSDGTIYGATWLER